MNLRDVVLACLPPVLWAVGYTVAKPALSHFQPLFTVAMAYGIAGLALYRPRLGMRTSFPLLLLISALGCSVQSALIFSGVEKVSASASVLVVQSQVPFAILAARIFGLEALNARRIGGIALSILGIGLVVGWPRAGGQFPGYMLIVSGTLCWGLAQGLIRSFSRDTGKQMMGAISGLAAPQLLVMSLLFESGQRQALVTATALDWSGMVFLALGSFVAAYAIWYGLLRRYRVDQVMPFALLMPVAGMVTGWALLGETISFTMVVGAATILGGLALVTGLPGRGQMA